MIRSLLFQLSLSIAKVLRIMVTQAERFLNQ